MCKICGCSKENEHIEFKVCGITLLNKKKVEKLLLGLPGVYHVHLHFFSGQAAVEYNSQKTSLTQMQEILKNNGFRMQ